MKTTTDFAKHLGKFLTEFLPTQRDVSPNTVKSYRDTFKLFLRFFEKSKEVSPDVLGLCQIDANSILAFLDYLETDRHCGKRTRNQRLAALHSFFRYVQLEAPDHIARCQQILAIPCHRYRQDPPTYLLAEEVKALLHQPDRAKSLGRRDALILSLLYDTGARVQELLDIRVGDFRLSPPACVRLNGKGRKTRIVPLMSRTVVLLNDYLGEHFPDPSGDTMKYVFQAGRNGDKLSTNGIRYILSKYAKATGLVTATPARSISPHTLRHTKAMHLLETGNPVTVIRDILGHSDTKTTQIYARCNQAMQAEALAKVEAMMAMPVTHPEWRKDENLIGWLESL